MVFQYINICQVPREMLKTEAVGRGFQHLPRDLANVNAWKTMFDPYIDYFDTFALGHAKPFYDIILNAKTYFFDINSKQIQRKVRICPYIKSDYPNSRDP